jgi:hypothetical protein
MTEIVNLMAMLTIFGAGAAGGVLVTVQRLRHDQAELQADKAQFAEMRELFTARAGVRVGSRGGWGPSGVDPGDNLPI